ncbi:hypothetical protein BFJ70_g2490 [Fusarium oxysporum]|nr:hypothetical protein BFJ70_g2490 [Fusarium oxysporum]
MSTARPVERVVPEDELHLISSTAGLLSFLESYSIVRIRQVRCHDRQFRRILQLLRFDTLEPGTSLEILVIPLFPDKPFSRSSLRSPCAENTWKYLMRKRIIELQIPTKTPSLEFDFANALGDELKKHVKPSLPQYRHQTSLPHV